MQTFTFIGVTTGQSAATRLFPAWARELGLGDPAPLPMTVKVLLEMLLRDLDAGRVEEGSVRALACWPEMAGVGVELPYTPARVLL